MLRTYKVCFVLKTILVALELVHEWLSKQNLLYIGSQNVLLGHMLAKPPF